MVTHQVDSMARLANELIESSRVGTGATPIQLQSIDVRSAMADATQSIVSLVQARQHNLAVVSPPETIRVQADPFRLEQILVNLLVNACNYTDPGGAITLDAWDEGEQAAIRVRDTGAGLTADLIPRIFEPFFRVNGEARSPGSGLGLGLALVKAFAERQGGTVTAASDGPGRGSEFILRLRKPKDEDSRARSASSEASCNGK
jgi:signal transduction histidine kinase